MTWVLVRKLLRDIRVAWIVTAVLLFLFQLLWAHITQRVTTQILDEFKERGIPFEAVRDVIFNPKAPTGKLVQAIIGGESIALNRADNFMTISYVHPLVLTILGIWALGRAANAIAGEIDRGTMELLLAQPIRRTQVVLAHLLVDGIVFPSLCGTIWLGTYCGTWWMGLQSAENAMQRVDPVGFLPALLCVTALLFSISGATIWISSLGRSRARVWGLAITIFLCMFLVNVLGQITEALKWLRPFTIYYHYQPQPLILHADWYANGEAWFHLGVLVAVGAAGYLGAWICFCQRDLPAPL
jgi:ABC-2 type transport system permease protein